MKSLACLLSLAALAATSCGDDGTAGPAEADADLETGADAGAAEVGRYEHPLYDDPADCPDDPLFNCTPVVELCADGSAAMLVTDIVNTGTYERAGASITTDWGPGDVPSRIVFAIAGDGQVLTDDWQDWDWTRADGGEFSFCN